MLIIVSIISYYTSYLSAVHMMTLSMVLSPTCREGSYPVWSDISMKLDEYGGLLLEWLILI